MNDKWRYLFLFACFSFGIFGQKKQDSLTLDFAFQWDESVLKSGVPYISKNNDTLVFSQLRFYVSALEISYENNEKQTDSSFYLIALEKENQIQIPIQKNQKIKGIALSVGVDKTTSVSGLFEGNLDPTNGMYWAWQSGYINIKIEGSSSSCKTRKNKFHFHLGGYLEPYYCYRKVFFETQNNEVHLNVNLANFFNKITLSQQNSIMIPGAAAMELATLFSHSITQK